MSSTPELPRACRLCGRDIKLVEVVGEYVFGGSPKQKFYRCAHCDIAFLYPAMTEEEEQKFYAKEFEKFMETRSGGDFDWSGPESHIKTNQKQYERRLPFFSEFISTEKSVLEIGCSSGFMLLPLKEKGVKVIGVEPSGGFTSFLRSNNIQVYSNLDELQTSSKIKRFDLVMHFFVLEHVRDPVGFLKRAFKFVKPGGHMVFEVPSRNDPLVSIYNVSAFHKFYWSVAHNWYFNYDSLDYVLKQIAENYEIINEQRYDLSNHITWALDGKPGGQGRYSSFFTTELVDTYRQSMIDTGYCDTLIGKLYKPT